MGLSPVTLSPPPPQGEEGSDENKHTEAGLTCRVQHSPLHRPRARRPRRAPPRAPCHPRGQSIGLDGDYCSPAAPVESRAQLMGHPQRSPSEPRDSLCLTHPRQGFATAPFSPQPHARSRGNSSSSDTEALPHSLLLQPLPLPALMHCRKSCPCTPQDSLAPDTASLTQCELTAECSQLRMHLGQ